MSEDDIPEAVRANAENTMQLWEDWVDSELEDEDESEDENESNTTEKKVARKNEWQPYIGPRDGVGWTNGDDVTYDDEPPGEIDQQAVDDFLQELPEDDRQQAREELGLTSPSAGEHVTQMQERGYVSNIDNKDVPNLRIQDAVDSKGLRTAGASRGASSNHMDVYEWEDGHEGFVTHYSESMQRDVTGEKPTLGERAIAADSFLRNIGFEDIKIPTHHLDREGSEDTESYLSTEALEGREVRRAPDSIAEKVNEEEAKRFAGATMLMGNSDLHRKNILVGNDGTVKPIDLDKSGGEFTSSNFFRRRGIRSILGSLRQIGIDMSRDELDEIATELATEIDIDEALDGVQNSQLSDEQHHQFRDNIKTNIEAWRDGNVL